jgi:hypothetical protein
MDNDFFHTVHDVVVIDVFDSVAIFFAVIWQQVSEILTIQ